MCPVASAFDLPGPFSILNEKVFDEDWSIADGIGDPVKDVKSSNHVRGWIDIVGFRNMSVIDEVRYVNGTPSTFAIVKRDAWHTPIDGVVVSFTSTSSVDDHYNYTTAAQHTSFHWKKRVCTIFGCRWKHYYEHLTVSYTTESPEVYNNTINDYEITITSYNNSVTPYTLIYVPGRYNIIKKIVEYKGNTTSCYNLTGLVKTNDRGTEHVRFLNEPGATLDENETITRRAEYYVINEAPLNWSLLNISVCTPYVVKNDTICNVTIYNSKPSDFVAWKPMVTLIGILSSFLIGIGIATGRIQL